MKEKESVERKAGRDLDLEVEGDVDENLERGVKGKGVQASRQIIVRGGMLRFGVVSKGMPTWAWFVGSAGRVEWMLGGQDLPLRHTRDPKLVKYGEKGMNDLEEVDVVLFQDFKPGTNHEVWSQPRVEAVVWLNQGLRGRDRMPNGWSLTRKTLHHEKVGGVMNAKITVYIAMRHGSSRMRWKQPADGFSNTLRQIVDPTLGGRMIVPPGEADVTLNTAKGLLDWKERRSAKVKLPTVYSKNKWAERRLGPQEIGHAMDVPGDKIENMNDKLLDRVLDGRAPGKLLAMIASSLQLTQEGGCSMEPERERKRKGEEYRSQAKYSKTKVTLGFESPSRRTVDVKRSAGRKEEESDGSKRQ